MKIADGRVPVGLLFPLSRSRSSTDTKPPEQTPTTTLSSVLRTKLNSDRPSGSCSLAAASRAENLNWSSIKLDSPNSRPRKKMMPRATACAPFGWPATSLVCGQEQQLTFIDLQSANNLNWRRRRHRARTKWKTSHSSSSRCIQPARIEAQVRQKGREIDEIDRPMNRWKVKPALVYSSHGPAAASVLTSIALNQRTRRAAAAAAIQCHEQAQTCDSSVCRPAEA